MRRYFGTAVEVLIGDHSGRVIAAAQPLVGAVSWRMNDVGQAPITLAKVDPRFRQDFLRIGNRIFVRFDNGLPNWGGVFDFSRTWGWHTVDLTNLSGEHLLSLAITGKSRIFESTTIDAIYSALLQEANSTSFTGVSLGVAEAGGSVYSTEYHYANLFQTFRDELADKLSANQFYVVAEESGGLITFTANLVEQRGTTKRNVALLEGHNIGNIQYTEQGPLINSWDVVGADLSADGDAWGDSRLVAHLDDEASISTYGLRAASVMRTSEETLSNLEAEAGQLLAASTNPARLFTVDAANLPPGRYADYDVGDSVWMEAVSYGWRPDGFAGFVTLEQREFDPQSGLCKLNLREVV